jgi:hypothetical protein
VTEEKIPLIEVHGLCYCLGLFIIFGPPNVIPRSTAEVASDNGQVILAEYSKIESKHFPPHNHINFIINDIIINGHNVVRSNIEKYHRPPSHFLHYALQ